MLFTSIYIQFATLKHLLAADITEKVYKLNGFKLRC